MYIRVLHVQKWRYLLLIVHFIALLCSLWQDINKYLVVVFLNKSIGQKDKCGLPCDYSFNCPPF